MIKKEKLGAIWKSVRVEERHEQHPQECSSPLEHCVSKRKNKARILKVRSLYNIHLLKIYLRYRKKTLTSLSHGSVYADDLLIFVQCKIRTWHFSTGFSVISADRFNVQKIKKHDCEESVFQFQFNSVTSVWV